MKEEKKINILSLFDGMSCGQIALNRAGISYDKYFASEIDKHAISVTMNNYPNTIQLGSVIDVDGTKLPKIDLLFGGSPCTSFSFAGKRNGMTTKTDIKILTLEQYLELKENGFEFEGQSYLFWEYVRLLHETKPKYFFLENVVMDKEWEVIINNVLGVEPTLINSSIYGAQFRERLYWTNIPFDMPVADKTILLKDILEDNIDYTHKCNNVTLQKSSNNIENIKKGTSGYSWFYEQQTYTKNSLTRTLKAGGGSGNIPKVLNDDLTMFRKLSPVECEKLQTVPENYTSCVSNNQRYRMLGNGWTVDVISHVFKYLKNII